MKQLILVFLGGGTGSILRYLISKTFNSSIHNFYLGTFLVNVIGCFLIGFIIGLSAKNDLLTQNQALLLTTGFCGGFTTFSSFALEQQTFLKNGDFLNFTVYTTTSILLGIMAVVFGFWLSKSF
ncbi:Putative fluoride ion transporter CrcB [Arenibacter antarcticus]|uniref:Fluoride-specific ion channel FluC n=1 Tax=Arenibacter antarcticus TaxID=2040469 RepID=A0ABW5VLV1_9FLAO|nr:fluoride efflux transporter CrcB [Arenibacter sp. H213]MCM4168710.1 fluoride efflux transporter CrcB [Arenibacter sp. H213]